MSIIDTSNNTIVSYVSGTTKAFTGQRLASFNWKTGTDKSSLWFGIKRESKAVSLPRVRAEDVKENLVLLMPHVVNLVQQTQDKIIREILDGSSDRLHISNEEISISSVVEYLDSSNESGRITKADCEKWFDEVIADNLMVSLAERLGVSEEPSQNDSDKISAMIAAFKGKISALAGGKTNYDPKTAKQLSKALSLAPEGDILADRLIVRLLKMQEVKEDDLLNAL